MQLKISVKHFGIAVVILSVLMGAVIFAYTSDLKKLNEYIHKDCGMPADICPVKNSIPAETAPAFILDFALLAIGLLLISHDKQTARTEFVAKRKFSFDVKSLAADEKKIFEILSKGDGGEFQSSLVEKSGMSKVSVSRILDKLEAKGLIERRRRGMSNFVILKGIAE